MLCNAAAAPHACGLGFGRNRRGVIGAASQATNAFEWGLLVNAGMVLPAGC